MMRARLSALSSAFRPGMDVVQGKPSWLSSVLLAGLATLAVCYPAWPGHFGYDALYAYKTSITGIENMVWPPLHAYMFWISRIAGAGVGGLFAAQTFVLFFSAALAASLLIKSRIRAFAAAVTFIGLFVLVPPVLGVAMSQWRDVPTASFAMLAMSLWLLASTYRSWPAFIVGALALGCSVALRYNAFPLFALIAPMMALWPFLGRPSAGKGRVAAGLVVALSIIAAWASTQWRLPDLKPVDAANTQFTIQLFDLLGVSACTNRSFLPPELTGGTPLTGAQVRELYDPRHAQMALGPHAGVPTLDVAVRHAGPLVDKAWRNAIPHHLGCYFAHRNIVFVEQLGLEKHHVFYPVHGRVDPNLYGIQLAHPAASSAVTRYVYVSADHLLRRPFWLYVFAAVATSILLTRREPRSIVCLALTVGAFGNVALLYFIGPAADARYLFPSNIFCAFVIAVAGWILAETVGSKNANRDLRMREPGLAY